MDSTTILWYSLNKDCGEIPKAPVESGNKEPVPKEPLIEEFSDDIRALSQKFPLLNSVLTADRNEESMTLEISLKEIFALCPRNRQRIDRYSRLQEYLKNKFGVKLIIKSQKTSYHETKKIL